MLIGAILMKNRSILTATIQAAIPNLLALYAFGSRIRGNAHLDSDLDLALLVAGYADPVQLCNLSADLGAIAGCEVDLLDFRAASTVMQHQIITTGERWWARDIQADLYELMVLSEKMDLDITRAEQLADIRRRGRVYGR